MANVNQINVKLIKDTFKIMNSIGFVSNDRPVVNSNGICDINKIKNDFFYEAMLWNNVIIKLMKIYIDLYHSMEVMYAQERAELTKNIIETLRYLANTQGYTYFEESVIENFECIKQDANVAASFGIITQEEYNELYKWTENEIRNIKLVKERPLENFRLVNLEFSFHNHYMRGNSAHFNGLSNDIFINKILDKMYENDNNSARIIKAILEQQGYYNRRVANILSDGTSIELYLEFDNPDGAGKVRFIRSGGENECSLCFNKQEGFDVTLDTETKDEIIERCMEELFNIISIVETL